MAAEEGGDMVVNGINGSANWIGIDPAAFPCVDVPVRRLVVARFPDALDLRSMDAEILVLAVHGRQDRRRWQGCSESAAKNRHRRVRIGAI